MADGKKLSWGIMGTGNIARQFSVGVNASNRCRLAAVGSRQMESARAFAAANRIPAAYAGYETLLADKTLDAIYISLPNSMHKEWTIKALQAGKHVLCEKPFASNRAQAQEMFDVAERAGRILVEAFMYRSHPLMHAVVDAVRRGDIGQIKLVRSSFCYRTTKIAGNVRFDPQLDGGGLMDVGCYCIDFAHLIAAAEPTAVHAVAQLHESGVDHVAAGTMMFANGIVSSFTCGMSVQADNTASICGTEGYIEVPIPWKPPRVGAVYTLANGIPPRMDSAGTAANPSASAPLPNASPRQIFKVDADMELYGLEADDFAKAVQDGAPPALSRSDTLTTMGVLDEMRRMAGIAF